MLDWDLNASEMAAVNMLWYFRARFAFKWSILVIPGCLAAVKIQSKRKGLQ